MIVKLDHETPGFGLKIGKYLKPLPSCSQDMLQEPGGTYVTPTQTSPLRADHSTKNPPFPLVFHERSFWGNPIPSEKNGFVGGNQCLIGHTYVDS